MSREVSDNNPADHGSLLADFNVQTKKPIHCVTDSAAKVQKDKTSDDRLGCRQSHNVSDEESEDSFERPRGWRGWHGDKRCGRQGHHTHCLRCQVLAFSCLCILLVGALFVYTVHRDQQTSAEVRGLREKVDELYSLCQLPAKQRSDSSHGGSGESVVASDQRNVVASDVFGERRLPGRQGAGGPSVAKLLGFAVGDSWNQGDNRWTTEHSHDEDDEDEDEEDENDEDEVVADDDVDEQKDLGESSGRVRRSAESETARPRKKRKERKKTIRHGERQKRDGGKKGCKKYEKCKSEVSKRKPSKSCRKTVEMIRAAGCIMKDNTAPPPVPAPLRAKPFTIKAVHFMSDFWNVRRKEEFGKESPLKFFQPADWMKDLYKNQSGQPIVSVGDGGYKVMESGLYLIYSSVMFHDIKPRQSQAVVVNGHKLFKCMDSVDYIDTDLPSGSNQAKYKTCAMTGVTHLKADDRLEVQNLYANTEIDLSTDATYFGAVLLSPGEIKE